MHIAIKGRPFRWIFAVLLAVTVCGGPIYSDALDRKAVCMESVVGDTITDAAKKVTGADIVIIPSTFIKNTATPESIAEANWSDVFAMDAELYKVQLSLEETKDVLELCVLDVGLDEDSNALIDVADRGYFPQVSGLVFKYDVSAKPGERIREIKAENGFTMADDGRERVIVCLTENMLGLLPSDIRQSKEACGVSLQDCAEAMTLADIVYTEQGRITEIGNGGSSIIGYVPKGLIYAIVAVFLLAALVKPKAEQRTIDF